MLANCDEFADWTSFADCNFPDGFNNQPCCGCCPIPDGCACRLADDEPDDTARIRMIHRLRFADIALLRHLTPSEGMLMNKGLVAAFAACLLSSVAVAQSPLQGEVSGSGCTGCGSAAPAYAPQAYAEAPMPMAPAGAGCNKCDKRFGLNPLIKRLMFWKKDTQCGTCGLRARFGGGCLGGNCAGQPAPGYGAAPFNPYPNGTPGTLVFPYNSNIRSPRDWYMGER